MATILRKESSLKSTVYTQVPFINMWWWKGLASSSPLPPESKENMDQIEREREEGRGSSWLHFFSFFPSRPSFYPCLLEFLFTQILPWPQWPSRPSSSGCVDADTQVSALVSGAAIMTALLENYRGTTGELAQEVKVLAVWAWDLREIPRAM